MLLRIASILLPVLSIVLIGYLYGRRHAPDMVTVNRINMDLFVPALVFVALAGKDVQLAQYGWLALAAAGVVLGSGLLAWPLAGLSTGSCRCEEEAEAAGCRESGAAGMRAIVS